MSIKFNITHRWSNAVLFTAEIDADENDSYSIKLGLAVQAAVKARADLICANLTGAALTCANLTYANLTSADLTGADLTYANLTWADLICANLTGAALTCANLTSADLTDADLTDANLTGANLTWADLSYANLTGADLTGADLTYANLYGAYMAQADLSGADLNGVYGLNAWIKCIQVEDWPISYTAEVLQIGCQQHSFKAWSNFSDAEIRAMDGIKALNFWKKWKSWVFQAIELAPAQPTKAAA